MIASHKVRLFRSLKQRLFINYRIFKIYFKFLNYIASMIEDYINNEFCNPFDEKPRNFFMKLEHCGRYLYALDNITGKDVIADISCATGYGSDLLAQKAKFVIGADINDRYLKEANRNYKRKNLKFLKTDLNNNIDLSAYNISTIISFETIEHTHNPFAVIKKFYNILPYSGRLILSFPNSKNETLDENGKNLDPFHLSVIEYEKMLNYLSDMGFEINRILGQSFINRLIAQVLKIEEDLSVNLENLYNYSPKNILQQSKLLAYPNDVDIEKSYSFVFDLIKK